MLFPADSAFFTHDVLAAVRRSGAHFSVTARMNKAVVATIGRVPEGEWTPIRYPQAVFDDEQQRWISDAEVAEVAFTAFTSRRKAQHLSGRLIVRRVKRLNPRPTSGARLPPASRASCSRPTATTRCSPTVP